MGAYTIAALVIVAWAVREVGVPLMALSTLVGALVAFGLSRYARAVTFRST